ncbi:MAG TPA: hypothetical protein DDY93_07625, partial [Dehalococcoidia bacterium]|nr:hypothetical protein [Dehalococcoidia bacterium]
QRNVKLALAVVMFDAQAIFLDGQRPFQMEPAVSMSTTRTVSLRIFDSPNLDCGPRSVFWL